MSRIFLQAEWRNLLMANYIIDPVILKPYLPCYTELDSFGGNHFVSLVGFLFRDTRVSGIGFPFHRHFEEVNLRFYVRYKEKGEWKRGVVFLKEIVPRFMITFIANRFYGEKYATHPMRHTWKTDENHLRVEYSWKVGSEWNYLKATAEKEAVEIKAGSPEEFITEHYWGYTYVNDQCSGVYQVAHPQWKVHPIISFAVHCNTVQLYGKTFVETLAQTPYSVFLADGSPIQVMKGSRIYS